MKTRCKWLVALLSMILIFANSSVSQAAKLSKKRQANADRIYEECLKHWDDYGCLPSVCISIGIVESGLGEACHKNNWWGLHGGNRSYASFEAGIKAYAKTVGNKTYYGNAKGQKDYKKQLKRLADGGYCASGGYYRKNKNVIKRYKLYNYDLKMFAALKKEKVKSQKSATTTAKADITSTENIATKTTTTTKTDVTTTTESVIIETPPLVRGVSQNGQ